MRLLVISPHADDETLGAGGTILKYKNEKHEVFWLNITNMKEEYGYSYEQVEVRQKQISLVREKLKIDGFFDLGLKPAYLDKYDMSELIQKISGIISETRPEIVFLPYAGDVHSDHKIVFEAAYSCTKVFRYPFIKKILCMEILSETDFACPNDGFIPDYFISIDDYLKEKIEIMKIYKSEIGLHPFPRSEESIYAIAAVRGVAAGTRYAEAFKTIKIIEY